MTQSITDIIHSCKYSLRRKVANTWWLCGHHGRWRGDISVVVWWWWSQRRIDASCTRPHCLGLLWSLQLIHQTVHNIYANWRRGVIVFIDRASPCILITVYKHVQECLQNRNRCCNFCLPINDNISVGDKNYTVIINVICYQIYIINCYI